MKRNFFIVLIALFALVLTVNAQENETETYNMVVKMPDGTTVTIGTDDVEEVSFNNGKLVISGQSLNEILSLVYGFYDTQAMTNLKIANIEAELAECLTKSELDLILFNFVKKEDIPDGLASILPRLAVIEADITMLKTQIAAMNSVPVNAIILSETSITIQPNETRTITASVLPDNASNKNVTWSSSNTSIATVDQTGKVTAKAVGSCTITCSATDGSGVKAECAVTVGRLVTDITLSQTSLSLTIPGTTTKTLTATVKPTNATNKNVTWASSDTSIATVENGKVTAIAAGTCTITCSATDGSGVKAECAVTVKGETASIVGTWSYRITDEDGLWIVKLIFSGSSTSGTLKIKEYDLGEWDEDDYTYTYSGGTSGTLNISYQGNSNKTIKVISLTSKELILDNWPNEGVCTFKKE